MGSESALPEGLAVSAGMDRAVVAAALQGHQLRGARRVVSLLRRDSSDGTYRYVATNAAGLSAVGLQAHEVLDQPVAQVLKQRAQEELDRHVVAARGGPPGAVHAVSDSIWTSEGLVRFDATLSIHHVDGDELVAWVGESLAADERQPRNQFEALFRAMPVPSYLWKAQLDDLVLLDANDAAYALSGGHVGQYLGQTAAEFFDDRPDVMADVLTCHRQRQLIRRVDSFRLRTTGEVHEMRATFVPVAPDLVLVSAEILTELRTAERSALAAVEELAASEARYRGLVELAPEAIAIHVDGHFAFVNPAAEALLGLPADELIGRSVLDFVPVRRVEEVLRRVEELGDSGVTAERSIDKIRRADGTTLEVDVAAVPVIWGGAPAVQVVARDVGLRTQTQRMEALGQMASGIAHDFSNVLTAVMGYASMARETLPVGHDALEDLRGIDRAVRPAVSMIERLLAFSREAPTVGAPIDLGRQVREAADVLRRLLGSDIVLETAAEAQVVAVADPGQVDQVLLNLVTNARDAMPAGGCLRIAIDLTTIRADGVGGLAPGTYARLVVADSGVGMDDETLARCMEPFFTTKPRGRGTGLGLASVYGAVRQGGGAVTVESAPSAGTTVTVLLPTAPNVEVPGDEPSRPPREHYGGASATILLAEADDTIRALARRVLEGAGYRVLTAADGVGAFALALEQSDPVDLLVSDLSMPKMGGGVLATFLAGRGRLRRVLYLAPGAVAVDLGELGPGTPRDVLRTPFRPDELLAAVHAALAC